MALKTKADLETLDVVYLGQPFVQVATTAIVATNLDTVYQAQPFYAVDPAGGVVEEGSASVTSTATMTVSGTKLIDFDVFTQAEVTVTAVGSKSVSLAATMASATDLIADINYTTDNDVAVQAEFQFTADGLVVRDYDVFAQADTNVTVSGTVTKDFDVFMQSDTNVTADGTSLKDFDVNIQAEAQFTAEGTVTKNFTANLEEAVSFSAIVQRNTDIDLYAFSESAVTTDFTRIRNGEIAAIESFTQFTADGTRTIDTDAVLSAQFEQFASVGLRVSADLTVSSTAALDSSISRLRQINRNPKTANRVGTPVISTAQSKFGGSSLYFASSSSQINYPNVNDQSADFLFGTGAWTIEAWIRPSSTNNIHTILTAGTETNSQRPKIYIDAGELVLRVNGVDRIISNTSISNNVWTHIAVSRNSSGLHRMFVNGVQQSQSWSNTTSYLAWLPRIGNTVNNDEQFLGYIDDLRITKGLARYTATFTAPTQQLRNDANTVLLLNFDGANNSTTFRDSASEYIDASASVSAVIGVKKQFAVNATSSATLTANVNYITDNDVYTQAEATLTATPGFIKDFSADITTLASTLTAAAKVGQFLVDLNSESAMTADVVTTVFVDADLSSSASLTSSLSQVIYGSTNTGPVGVTGNAGNEEVTAPFLRFTNGTSPITSYDKFVMSFWANDAIGYVFDGDPEGPGSTIGILPSNSIPYLVYSNLGNSSPGRVSWKISDRLIRKALDGYHHFLIRVDTTKSTDAEKFRAFVDGEEIPLYSVTGSGHNFRIGPNSNLMLSSETSGSFYTGAEFDAGFGNQGDEFQAASLYQFYLDYGQSGFVDYPIENSSFRNKFYPYKDLGSDGTASGLDQPKQFVKLNNYSSISNGGTLGGSYAWKKLVYNSGTNLKLYTLQDHTPTSINNGVEQINTTNSTFNLLADGVVSQFVTANLNSSSNLSIQASKSVGVNADITANAAAETAALRTKQLAADILSEGFVLSAVAKVADFVVPMTVTSQFVANGTTNILGSATINSDTNLLADINLQATADAVLNTESTLTAGFNVVISADAVLSSDSALAAEFDRLILASADLNSATDLLAQTVGNVTGGADLVTEFTLTAQGLKTARANADITASAQLTASVDRVVRFSADIASQGFVLVAGEVLQLDPELTYVIEQETRTLVITGESRLLEVDQESRVYIITEETREYTVDQSTAVNII